MSLRKSPGLTPELLAAARRNAQHSTGPRTPAAKDNTRMNALKHGLYAAPANHLDVMLELGEDPQEFEFLTQELMTSYGPGDALWKKQIDDLARLYWRRSRLERARAGVMRRALQAVEDWQHRRRQQIAAATFDASQREILGLPLPEPADPDVRLRRILSSLEVIREEAQTSASAVCGFPNREPEKRRSALPSRFYAVLEDLYQDSMGWRAARICRLLRLFSDSEGQPSSQAGTQGLAPVLLTEPHEAEGRREPETSAPAEQAGERQYSELLRLLDEEIASVREEFEYAEQANAQKAAIERDACLAPVGETWGMLLRQENALDRAIDRKVRILLSLRKEYSDDKLTASIPPAEGNDPEMQEIEQMLGIDIPSDICANGQARTSKMQERSGNVTENKAGSAGRAEIGDGIHEGFAVLV